MPLEAADHHILEKIMKVVNAAGSNGQAAHWQHSEITHQNTTVPLIRLHIPAHSEWNVRRRNHDLIPTQVKVGSVRMMEALADKIDECGVLRTVKANMRGTGLDKGPIVESNGTVSLVIKPASDSVGAEVFARLRTLLDEKGPAQPWEKVTARPAPRNVLPMNGR